MLRSLYCAVLRLHPRYFRERFADEMQSIFDQAQSRTVAFALFIDAAVSLGRQWTLRSGFWEEPALAGSSDVPSLFVTGGNSRPRAIALFYGAILSIFVLNGVVWTFGYAWSHPFLLEIRHPMIKPPQSWNASAATTVRTQAPEVVLIPPEGRVVLVFSAPATGSAATPASPDPQTRRGPDPPPRKSGMVF
jgi:hypothetical protein